MRILTAVVSFFATVFLLQPSPALALSGDLNCSDFGSRERAQFEMNKKSFDVHRLDGDSDGKACEWNSATGWWGWPLSSVALVFGRFAARRKKADHRVVPGWQGLWHNYVFHEDGGADTVVDRWLPLSIGLGVVALPVVAALRDHVLPRSFTALVVNALAAGLLGLCAYVMTWHTNEIDSYR